MAKFADTPAWKRAMKWDPEQQRLIGPGPPCTKRQLRYLRNLCERAGVEYRRPAGRREAQSMIDRLKRSTTQRG